MTTFCDCISYVLGISIPTTIDMVPKIGWLRRGGAFEDPHVLRMTFMSAHVGVKQILGTNLVPHSKETGLVLESFPYK